MPDGWCDVPEFCVQCLAIPTVALDAVQLSIRAKQLPHLVGYDAEFLGRQPVCAAHSPHSLARIQS